MSKDHVVGAFVAAVVLIGGYIAIVSITTADVADKIGHMIWG